MNKILLISIVAAICTGIAGILHLTMLPAFNTQMTVLFLVGGLAQIFWIIPTVKNWGKIWDYIGIVGTIAFVLYMGYYKDTRKSNNRKGRNGWGHGNCY